MGPDPRAHSDPMELDRRSSLLVWSHFLRRTCVHFVGKCSSVLYGRIFFDEPVSTSSKNPLIVKSNAFHNQCGSVDANHFDPLPGCYVLTFGVPDGVADAHLATALPDLFSNHKNTADVL